MYEIQFLIYKLLVYLTSFSSNLYGRICCVVFCVLCGKFYIIFCLQTSYLHIKEDVIQYTKENKHINDFLNKSCEIICFNKSLHEKQVMMTILTQRLENFPGYLSEVSILAIQITIICSVIIYFFFILDTSFLINKFTQLLCHLKFKLKINLEKSILEKKLQNYDIVSIVQNS